MSETEKEPTVVIDVKQAYLTRLGREIKISPKSLTTVSTEPGGSIKINTECVSVSIGIGHNHTAYLIMPKAAWGALLDGANIEISTTEEFKKMYGNNVVKPLIK